ncbi:MAG: DUF4150 domain-containing protein [Algicola sp.]|nr:DUF4150 domain-containing protein [Algicola sp.]
MGNPIAPAKGIAFAFPDICLTNVSGTPLPVPYPNVAQLADAKNTSKVANKELLVGGEYILLDTSIVKDSSGAEAADPSSGVTSGTQNGMCYIDSASGSVFFGADKAGLVRFMDPTQQNAASAQAPGNAKGMVLSADPSVLVGD